MNIESGVTLTISEPTTYTMHYADGAQTYTERFVRLHFDRSVVDQHLKPYGSLLTGVASLLGTTGTYAVFGLALTAANHLISSMLVNPDGSLTLLLAYHYWGTQQAGVDPTAAVWPLPGVDPEPWFASVNRLLRFAS